MYDLEKPLYSGLVMSLFILNLNTSIPVSKELQAAYWKQHIMPHGRKIFFIRLANQLEQRNDCASAQIDLVFVIDSSGSVSEHNFNKTKIFLENIVRNLDIGPDKTRVAVIRFSTNPHVSFSLSAHTTNSAVRKAIDAIDYDGGGTATGLALDEVRTSVFTNKRKSAAAKVLVLVTDGQSDNEMKTVAAAQKLKDAGVTIFTIGVVNPRVSELTAAASEPSCTHYIDLKDYNEIDFIVREIESDSCKAPTVVEEHTQLRNNAIPKTNETKQQVLQITNTTKSALDTIVVVKVQCGVVTVYASFHNSYPNEADYDYKTSATDYQPGELYLAGESELNKLALTVLSKTRFDLNSSACDNPSYDIYMNPVAPTVVEEHTQLLNMAIPKTNETRQQVLQVTNTTKSTLGTTVVVNVQCGVVTVYGSFNNSYPNEADYDYKTSATDYQPGKLFLVQESELDKLILTVLSKKRFDLNSSACDNPSYNVSFKPTAPRTEMVCLVKEVNSPCTAKQLDSACYNTTPVVGEVSQLYNNSILGNDEIQERVLEISNSTDSSGSTILVSAQCAEVTVYGAFNNRHPFEADHDYKTTATDSNPGKIIIPERESQTDNLTLTILSRRQRGLISSDCDHPSYKVIINPEDSKLEVVCHRKQDERLCTPAESESKYSKTSGMCTSTASDIGATKQLLINAWIYAGLLLVWQMA
ncbi:uncharacterized protein LOC115230178 isoform X1 [Octopus sinensis]|uniref:Uncharacterized protein LOC115230178 isoform X1 n=1 Tax=Octopus sinensis TaxID=2607531 RepID=A0A6P7U3Y7_9MOLL|nr:uncharacterized protein LOC115230178 isoform X1 [Octopus sinensis]